MNKKPLLVSILFPLILFFISVAFASADTLTAAPSAAGTDDLIGANATWVFTATTTGAINQGNIVQFVLPVPAQSQPFTFGSLSVATGSNVILNTTATSTVAGITGGNGPSGPVIYGYASSTVSAGTTFSVTISGINNAAGQLSSMSNLGWNIRAGTSTNPAQPFGSLSATAFIATSTKSLIRAGGALVSDNNSNLVASSLTPGATNVSYTFSIKTTTQIPIGGKIGINFPATYSLVGATTTATENISNNTTAQVAAGAIATTSSAGVNRVVLTTSNAVVNAGDVLTVVVNGITNPGSAGVYQPFSVFTTKSNNGLLDGSYFGFEQSDYSNGAPPPVNTVYIGGLDTLNIQVLKQSGGSNVALSGSDLTNVEVGAGCPDKQYFMGLHWLNSSSVATWKNILDCNYMLGVNPFSQSNQSFYQTYLPPAFKSVNLVSSGGVGQTATTTLVFAVPNATTTVTLTGGVSGAQAFIQANSADNQSFSKVYTDTTYATPGFNGSGTGYAEININSGEPWNFNVYGGTLGSAANFTDGSGNEYWAPVISPINLTSGTTTNVSLGSYAFQQASNTLNVTLQDTNGSPLTNACVGITRTGGGIFQGAQDTICAANSGSNYTFKAPTGTIQIQVSRNGFGAPAEYPVSVSGTTNKTITLSAPSNYISVTVQTSGGTPINGAPVFAVGGSGGNASAMTNTSGTATIYVQPGTYAVQGFAPAFGSLTSQNATVTGGSNPSITFTVNTGSLKTISGQVTENGTGVAGIDIGASGTGSTNGGNGAQTDANGNYTLYVPAGTYQVGAWSSGTGALSSQTVNVSSGNASGINWSLNALGTLKITILHSSTISPLFAGAFNAGTGLGNGTNSWTTSGTSQSASISLPAGTYNVQTDSPSLGQFGSQSGVVISAGGTTNLSFDAASSTTLVTLSGSVTSSGTGVSGLAVWASRVNGPGFFSTQTDTNGNYSLTMPSGISYTVGVRSLSYIANQGDVAVAVSGNTTQNFTLASAGSTITGKVVDSNGNGIANAWVSGFETGVATSTQIGSPTDAGGNYSLNVQSASTWNLVAQGPCYPRSTAISATAGNSGKNITLSQQSGCSVPTPTESAVTDSSGGQVSSNNTTLNIPASALGTSQSSVNVSVSNAANVVSSANATPLAGSVKDITATNASGKDISSLNTNASLVITYDPSQLPVGFDESTLQMGYFDNTTGQWEPVAATVNTTNHTLTAQISHFTEYGPILPGVPDAPSGLSASAASASSINLSWTAAPTATSYTIYRSSTNSGFTSSIATGVSGTNYSDTGLSASTQYYYEVAGVNTNGEGLNSSSANATTNANAASSGGGGGNGPIVGSSGGGGVGQAIIPTSSTTTTSVTSTSASTNIGSSLSDNPTHSISALFTRPLRLGSHGSDVSRLQALLGVEQTGYFGPLTQAAVEAFQAKYGVITSGSPGTTGYGLVGPKTRAMLVRVFGSAQAATMNSSNVSGMGPYTFPRNFVRGLSGQDVHELQIVLNSDPSTQVATSGPGSQGNETTYFGAATMQAVEKFQVKYGIAALGQDGYGLVGPKTRTRLEAIFAAMNHTSTTNPQTATTANTGGSATSSTSSNTSSATTTSVSTSNASSTVATTTSQITATTTASH